MILARDSPSEHPFISVEEKNYIENSLPTSLELRKVVSFIAIVHAYFSAPPVAIKKKSIVTFSF